MPTPTKTTQAPVKHTARTIFAALFGLLAILLVLSSIVSVWLYHTLTDTKTYVKTVAPLATEPAIQNFVAQKVSEQVVKNAPTPDLANTLLPGVSVAGQTQDQVKAQLQPLVSKDVMQVINSPSFAELWRTTNQSASTQLLTQLNSNSSTISLDLNPVIVGVTKQLKTTSFGAMTDQIAIPPDAGKINLKDSGIDQLRQQYRMFKSSTFIIVAITIVSAILSVVLSVHHSRTIRRILIFTGVTALLLAGAIQTPSIVGIPGADAVTQKAVLAIIQTVFRSLQVGSLVLAGLCIAGAVGSKIFEVVLAKQTRPNKAR